MPTLPVNEVLSPFGQNHGATQPQGERQVPLLRFVDLLRNSGIARLLAELLSFPAARSNDAGIAHWDEDPEFPGRSWEEARRLKENAAQARRERVQQADETRRDRESERQLTLAMLVAEEQRRAVARLSADVADVRKAVTLALERSSAKEMAARRQLDEARNHALVLVDGRRVYFTRDGSKLYAEDGNEVLDPAVIAEARQLHSQAVTSHEDFVEWHNAWQRASDGTQRLQSMYPQLDRIEERLAKRELDPEEVLALRKEMDDIIASLPADARAEYDRLQTARRAEGSPSYRAADPAFDTAPVMNAEFRKAATGLDTALNAPAEPDRNTTTGKPAYRAAPEF